ncbi:MAG: metallophosphoesterase, partial [Candidatus Sericytochromatia bacterium]|nr:metallophosphoesterase [Candidatus Sericytochromatia bacterium]
MVQGVQGGHDGEPSGLTPAIPPTSPPSNGQHVAGGLLRPAAPVPSPTDRLQTTPSPAAKPLHVVFFTDANARMPLIDRLVEDVNARHPDLVIDGGDRVDDATAPEFARTDTALSHLETTLVALHVPPLRSKERLTTKISKVAPIKFASPVMTQPDQVARFTALMSRYQVSAVLAGHTHHPDQLTRDGVQYIVAGAAGGQTPGMGIANEFLDSHVQGRDVAAERIKLNESTTNPAKWGYGFFRYSSDLNGANHKAIGWSYTPSVSVQRRTGFRVSQTDHGSSLAGAATASFDNTKPKKGPLSLKSPRLSPSLPGVGAVFFPPFSFFCASLCCCG